MTPSPGRPWPWRSVGLARLTAVVALVIGVPPFLRMPPWVDLTLYDVAAHNLLQGGVHYRDVFDTNLPGFVWALTGIRAVLGWSVEALRAVDLLIVAGLVVLLDRLAAGAGANRAARAWMVAGIALFYPFLPESTHAQRDVWMLLPALAAVTLRIRRLRGPDDSRGIGVVGRAALEGALWGLAVWVKPHVVVPAAAVWVVTAPRLYAQGRWPRLGADFLGNLLGGLVVGAAGVAQLVLSGTWPHFVEVFTFWNSGYAAVMLEEFPTRLPQQLSYFPPWSYLQVVSLPMALLLLAGNDRWLPAWLGTPAPDEGSRLARRVLAALYLGWTAQALLLQRQFHYVHVPEILLLLAVLATQGWSAGFASAVAVAILSGAAWMAGPSRPDWLVLHPAADKHFLRQWPDCWQTGLSEVEYRRRMGQLARIRGFHAANDWEQLGEVVDELRRRGAGDGDVICWHDAPHAAYRMLGVRPGFRFQHVSQMAGIGPAQHNRVHEELQEAIPHARWVISDLMRVAADDPARVGDLSGTGPDLLPPTLVPEVREEFPYTHPAVFRSGGGRGRYVLHELRTE